MPEYEDHKDSLVAFVDLLGFDQRARAIQNSTDFENISRLLFAIKATTDNFSEADGLLKNFKFTAISDCIIASVDFKDIICTVGLLQLLQNFQYEILVCFKTLVRGYIARGNVYHKDGLLFGPGYSKAYEGEKMIGHAPRIVLSPDVVKDAKRVIDNYTDTQKMTTAFDFLQEDKSDGFYYIDYLKPNGMNTLRSKEELIEERNLIKLIIEENLSKYCSDYRILPKYKWLESYFNRSVDTRLG